MLDTCNKDHIYLGFLFKVSPFTYSTRQRFGMKLVCLHFLYEIWKFVTKLVFNKIKILWYIFSDDKYILSWSEFEPLIWLNVPFILTLKMSWYICLDVHFKLPRFDDFVFLNCIIEFQPSRAKIVSWTKMNHNNLYNLKIHCM